MNSHIHIFNHFLKITVKFYYSRISARRSAIACRDCVMLPCTMSLKILTVVTQQLQKSNSKKLTIGE